MSEVTLILERVRKGDPNAAEELMPLVYGELRNLAAAKLARETPGQTLQPTALVHEAWLRLSAGSAQNWRDRSHFVGAAAEAMRRILIDNARRKGRVRHGRGFTRADLEQVDLAIDAESDVLLALDEALDLLQQEDAVKAELVRLRFYVGLTIVEAGALLGLSESTAKRAWNYARAWLHQKLREQK